MAQKTKVKELVGRGLHSYHTKALQQMDRIEKKNKEQNHKISILSNELDNDYLTKTEEGSVISLEHSKEGMVYLDELQGNTLVNYCTDGSKEMTLNGDIDVEGVSVTTTEGVDGGKIDVMCEGNTLVNLFDKNIPFTVGKHPNIEGSNIYHQKEITNATNGTFHIIAPIGDKSSNSSDARVMIFKYNKTNNTATLVKDYPSNTNSDLNIVINLSNNEVLLFNCWSVEGNNFNKNYPTMMILKGDWTNREIPPYFEGMKSVGQDDENGHKIEILSNNKNFYKHNLNKSEYVGSGLQEFEINSNGEVHSNYVFGNGHFMFNTFKIPLIGNTNYTLSCQNLLNNYCRLGIRFFDKDGIVIKQNVSGIHENYNNHYNAHYIEMQGETATRSFITPSNASYCYVGFLAGNCEYIIKHIQLEIGDKTVYSENKLNKKEISLNEPLRGVDNVKDKFVKIGGKWFIERNCIGVQFKDLKYTMVNTYQKDEFPDVIGFRLMGTGVNSPIMCDKYAYTNDRIINFGQLLTNEEYINVYNSGKEFFITIKKAKLETLDIEGLMNYFSNNSLEIVGKADSTTYEPITDATLTTYLDTTHISNNSIIPCNMKIKNSGYNTIIKPSTLYTVALDTNKSGTIGINLGGAKVTTTNNVATITTPATLTDDSLRLYGKDIKGSKVRLLEGDKTNWIPSFFEGMKSSFEDKLQDDSSYKMEISSNNKNLLRLEDIKFSPQEDNRANFIKDGFKLYTGTNLTWHSPVNIKVNVKPYTTYTFGITKKVVKDAFPDKTPTWGAGYLFIREMGDKVLIEGKVKDNNRTYFKFNSGKNTQIRLLFSSASDTTTENGEYDFTQLDLRESGTNLDFFENKYNKIQFSSIEPLRSIGDVKDKFVFKEDGKLMIERNCRQVLGSEFVYTRVHQPAYTNRFAIQFSIKNCYKDHMLENVLSCNVLPYAKQGYDKDYDNISSHKSNDGVYISLDKDLWGYDGKNGANILQRFIAEKQPILTVQTLEPTYEEIPFELQKIILEGYENGTLFFDTNIPPTSTVTYAGETPIVKSVKLNKTEVLNNTEDINDNIIPYLMDMDYRVVMLQLATEELEGGVSMARLFGGTYEMIKRDILSKRLTREEYGYRLADYYNAGKLTEEQVRELEDLR